MCASSSHIGKNRLYKPKNLVLRKVDDFFLALNPDLPNIMVMDDIGKRFFELCESNIQAEDIVKEILKERRRGVSRKELYAFISSMIDANFLSLKPPLPPQKIYRRPEKLRRLCFHITRDCNLRCKHCYVEAGRPLENELTTAEALRIIDDFAQLGGEHLVITGGEPFQRRELLLEILGRAREARIDRIFVETNGTLISDKDVDIFKKHNIEVGVSLDGAVQETNDYVRGAGSFKKSIDAIKKLVRTGVTTKIGVTLMKPNMGEGEKMACLAKDLGVKSISFSVVSEMGRAKTNKNLSLNPEEIYSTLLAAWRKAREVGIASEYENQFKSLENLTRRDMCGAGIELLMISSNGDVYPCNMFLEFQEFKAGNVREQQLEDIWKNSDALKKFSWLSVLDIEGCKDCEIKFVCGVCPASIYRDHRGFARKSRFCRLYKGIWWMLIEELAEKMWNE